MTQARRRFQRDFGEFRSRICNWKHGEHARNTSVCSKEGTRDKENEGRLLKRDLCRCTNPINFFSTTLSWVRVHAVYRVDGNGIIDFGSRGSRAIWRHGLSTRSETRFTRCLASESRASLRRCSVSMGKLTGNEEDGGSGDARFTRDSRLVDGGAASNATSVTRRRR